MSFKDKLLETEFWARITARFPVQATKLLFRLSLKRKLDLSNPRTLNEKMQWLKLYKYRNNEKVTKCADKYAVREYLIEKGCSSILNELYGVWNSADEIEWDKLPNKFVLKCTHGSGYNYICKDKRTIDTEEVTSIINKWMNESYGAKYCELIYDHIKPRIIAEKYIDTKDGKAPTDWKFFCSYGNPKFLYVMQGNDEIQDYYTADWKWLPIHSAGRPNSNNCLQKPAKYEKMMEYAQILSKDFPLVRVDFYYENNTVIFGEMTFLTTGGYTKYDPEEYDLIFGRMFPDVREVLNS